MTTLPTTLDNAALALRDAIHDLQDALDQTDAVLADTNDGSDQ